MNDCLVVLLNKVSSQWLSHWKMTRRKSLGITIYYIISQR